MAFLRPEEIINKLPLERGMVVADFGAGIGAFTVPIAKRLGEGMVFAVDINQEVLGNIDVAKRAAGLSNIEVIWGDVEKKGGSRLADRVVDLVVLANVLFQSEDRSAVIAEAERILKPRGTILAIDWTDSFGGLGPTSKSIISPEDVKKLFGSRGFTLYNEIDAGDHHYGFLFRRETKER